MGGPIPGNAENQEYHVKVTRSVLSMMMEKQGSRPRDYAPSIGNNYE